MAFRSSTLTLLGALPLAMASRAAGQFLDLIFLDQFFTQRDLIDRRLIIHGEYIFARAHEALRRTVTLEAPIHIKCVFPPRQRHVVDTSVTGGAADSLVDMDTMVEIDETGKIMDSRPLDRFARAETLFDRRQNPAVRPNLSVTIHAGFGRREAGERAFLYRRVAKAAIDPGVTDVMLMTERHRLATRHADICDVGGFMDRRQCRNPCKKKS